MTHDQLFFLNYAQIWCGTMRPEDALTKIRSSVHSPGPIRVLGPLSNSQEFANAYNCPADSPMNPRRKCSVWWTSGGVWPTIRQMRVAVHKIHISIPHFPHLWSFDFSFTKKSRHFCLLANSTNQFRLKWPVSTENNFQILVIQMSFDSSPSTLATVFWVQIDPVKRPTARCREAPIDGAQCQKSEITAERLVQSTWTQKKVCRAIWGLLNDIGFIKLRPETGTADQFSLGGDFEGKRHLKAKNISMTHKPDILD